MVRGCIRWVRGNRMRTLVALMACVALGASGTLHAQRGSAAREPRPVEQSVEPPPLVLDEATRSARIAEMEQWLGRLVGRFRTEGRAAAGASIIEVRSTAICSGIGDGPGVRCFIGEPNMRTGYLGVLPILYLGIDQDALEVQMMVVSDSQVGAGSGKLEGDTVQFSDNWKVCHRVPSGSCWVDAIITATPDEEIFVGMAADTWTVLGRPNRNLMLRDHSYDVELKLHRDSSADAVSPRAAPGETGE